MSRRPAQQHDLQSLKQANVCLARALALYEKRTVADDKEAFAQASLAWRFLDEFVAEHDNK